MSEHPAGRFRPNDPDIARGLAVPRQAILAALWAAGLVVGLLQLADQARFVELFEDPGRLLTTMLSMARLIADSITS